MTRLTRARTLLVAALASSLVAAGCGSDDEESSGESAQKLTITADASGKLTAPKTAKAGATEITLKNSGKKPAEAQLIRVEGKRSTADVFKALEAATQGKAFEDWFFAGGGVGTTGPGQSASVTQDLEPSSYYVVNEEVGRPKASDLVPIDVSGDGGGELPSTDATVTATEYEFSADGLTAGKNEVTFENAGGQPHHLLASQLKKGATIEQAEKFLKTDKGKPPFAGSQEDTLATTVLDGGVTQVTTLDLKPGKYALFCFIQDRQGGPPHVVKGMVSEAEVE